MGGVGLSWKYSYRFHDEFSLLIESQGLVRPLAFVFRFSLLECEPVLIAFSGESRNVLLPFLFHFLVVVEIELAFDNLPGFRVTFSGVAVAHGPGAITAILRRVLLRLALEQLAIASRCEIPFRAVPFRFELAAPFDGLAFGEISDRVIT